MCDCSTVTVDQEAATVGSPDESGTVDQEAATVGSTDEADTVPEDDPTVARPHLLVLHYPPSTPKQCSDKFPGNKVRKAAGGVIVMGRKKALSDVLLNDETIPRQFVELSCRVEGEAGPPRWYVKNVSGSKPVRVSQNGSRTTLKNGMEKELTDGCELKLEMLKFLVETEDGDLGSRTEFEVEFRCQDGSSSNGSSSLHRQNSTSTDSSGSLTSAAGLAGWKTSSQAGPAHSGPQMGTPMCGALPGTQGMLPSTAVSAARHPAEHPLQGSFPYYPFPYPYQYPPGWGQAGYGAPPNMPPHLAAYDQSRVPLPPAPSPGYPSYQPYQQQAAGLAAGVRGPGAAAGFQPYNGDVQQFLPVQGTASPHSSGVPGYQQQVLGQAAAGFSAGPHYYNGPHQQTPGQAASLLGSELPPDYQGYPGPFQQVAGQGTALPGPGQAPGFQPYAGQHSQGPGTATAGHPYTGHHPGGGGGGGGRGPPGSGHSQYPQVAAGVDSLQQQTAGVVPGVAESQAARPAADQGRLGALGHPDLQQPAQGMYGSSSVSQYQFPSLESQPQGPYPPQPGVQGVGGSQQGQPGPPMEGRLHGPLSIPQQPAPGQSQQSQATDRPAAVVTQPESAGVQAAAGALPLRQGPPQDLTPHLYSSTGGPPAPPRPVTATPSLPQDVAPHLYCYTEGELPAAPPVTQLSSLKLATPVQATSQLATQPVTESPANSLSQSGPGGWTVMVDSAGFPQQVSGGPPGGGDQARCDQTPGPSPQLNGAGTPHLVDHLLQPPAGRTGSPGFSSGSQHTASAPPNLPHGTGAGAFPGFPAVAASGFSSLTEAADNGNRLNLRSHERIAAAPPPSADFASAGSYLVQDLQAANDDSEAVNGSLSSSRQPQEDDERRPQEHDDRQ